MHTSIFSYSITRPYPFSWFTPVVVIGGLILTVVFTLLNLSSSVYSTKAIYTSDPNATIGELNARWFRKAPFNWQGNTKAECQPATLSVGSSIFTANLGFRYTITGISAASDNEQSSSSAPSMQYRNAILRECQVQDIVIFLKKVDSSKPPSRWNSWDDFRVTSKLWCIMMSDAGAMKVTMEAFQNNAQRNFDYIIADDPETHASVWWGTRLLNAYLNGVLTAASRIELPSDAIRGEMKYMPNSSQNDIKSSLFFNAQWSWDLANSSNYNNDRQEQSGKFNAEELFYSPALTEGLHVAKLLHSLFAQDLGNCLSPNLFRDEDSLKYAILSPDNMNRKPGGLLNHTIPTPSSPDGFFFDKIPTPGRTLGDPGEGLTDLKDSLEKFKRIEPPILGPLLCKETTIVAEYLCSVPQKKSIGVLLWSLLLANLVFLQAAWKLLQWTAGGLVAKRGPSAMACEGCTHSRSNELLLKNSEQQIEGEVMDEESGERGNGYRRLIVD